MEDFNRRDTLSFRNAFRLKQIVNFHTRGNQTLDLKRPAFGLSDHASIELQPFSRSKLKSTKRSIITRDQRKSYRVALSSYLEKVNIANLVKNKDTCHEKVQVMEEAIISGMDAIMPLKEKSISANKAPWMKNSLKRLIRRQQKALANNNLAEYNQLRNKVNRDQKAC